MNNKYILNMENNGPTSYYTSANDKTIFSKNSNTGVQVISVPNNEQELEIYKLLEKNCNLFFCKNELLDNFIINCKVQFTIFAINDKGEPYGTIGGIGDIEDDYYPIGYVSNKGQCGRIANNLKEFLQLIVFYPFWLELLNCPEKERQHTVETLENEKIKLIPDYLINQQKIAEILNIQKNKNSIETLFLNLKQKPYFVVHGVEKEQNKKYENLLLSEENEHKSYSIDD